MQTELYYLRSFEQEITKELLPLLFDMPLNDPLIEPYHTFYGIYRTDVGVYIMVDHKVAGGAWIRLLKNKSIMGNYDETTPELVLAIKPAYRGLKLAMQIMNQLLIEAAQNFSALYVCVKPQQSDFFVKFGFEFLPEDTLTVLGYRRMHKKLQKPLSTPLKDHWFEQTQKWRNPNAM